MSWRHIETKSILCRASNIDHFGILAEIGSIDKWLIVAYPFSAHKLEHFAKEADNIPINVLMWVYLLPKAFIEFIEGLPIKSPEQEFLNFCHRE